DDVDAVRGARRRAQVAGDALLAPQLVHMQEVLAAEARLQGHGLVRVLDRPLLTRDVRGGRQHPLDDGARVLDDFADDAHKNLGSFKLTAISYQLKTSSRPLRLLCVFAVKRD